MHEDGLRPDVGESVSRGLLRASYDVVVVGGGVAGTGIANSLRASGLSILLVETSQTPLQLNRGDQIQPSGVKLLDDLGLLDYFHRRGALHVKRSRRFGPEGDQIGAADYSFLETPLNYVLSLPHAEIRGALMDAAEDAPDIEIARGFRMTDLIRSDDGSVCGIRGSFKGVESVVRSRIVVGCDGAQSKVREAVGIKTERQQYPYRFLMLTGMRSPDQPDDENREYWTSQGFVGMWPMPNGRVRCPVQAEADQLKRWRSEGLDALHAELSDFLPAFAGVNLLDDDMHSYAFAMHNCESYVADGVVLVGDSAHGTSPMLAFGMNMALRDGHHAAQVIKAALAAGDVSARALRPYEQRCRGYNQRVIDASHEYSLLATAKLKTQQELDNYSATSPLGRPDGIQAVRELLHNEY